MKAASYFNVGGALERLEMLKPTFVEQQTSTSTGSTLTPTAVQTGDFQYLFNWRNPSVLLGTTAFPADMSDLGWIYATNNTQNARAWWRFALEDNDPVTPCNPAGQGSQLVTYRGVATPTILNPIISRWKRDESDTISWDEIADFPTNSQKMAIISAWAESSNALTQPAGFTAWRSNYTQGDVRRSVTTESSALITSFPGYAMSIGATVNWISCVHLVEGILGEA